MNFENPTITKEPKGWKERIKDEAKEKVIAKIKAIQAFDEGLKSQMIKAAEDIFADNEYLKSFEEEWAQRLQNQEADPEEVENRLSSGLAAQVKKRIDEKLNL